MAGFKKGLREPGRQGCSINWQIDGGERAIGAQKRMITSGTRDKNVDGWHVRHSELSIMHRHRDALHKTRNIRFPAFLIIFFAASISQLNYAMVV